MKFEAWSSLARQTVRPRTLVITAVAVASVSSHLSGAAEEPHTRGERATAEDGLPPPLARQPWDALAKASGVVVSDASGAAMEFAATEVVATEAAAANTAVGAAAGAVAGAVEGAAVEGGGAQAAVAARGINVAAQVESPPSPSRVDMMRRRRRVDCLPGLSHQDDERLHLCFPIYRCVHFRDLQQTNKRMRRGGSWDVEGHQTRSTTNTRGAMNVKSKGKARHASGVA